MTRWIVLVSLLVLSTPLIAQSTRDHPCVKDSTLVRVQYGFKDTDAQVLWVYRSLKPSISVGTETAAAESIELEAGVAQIEFCISSFPKGARLVFRAGPRTYELAPRPIFKDARGKLAMTDVLLLDQPRPDWVIVQSVEQLDHPESRLPTFDIAVFNFGQPHAGGRVRFEALRLGVLCAKGSAPSRVSVHVSLSGRKLKITSSDPEFPEEQITRVATLETSIANNCSGNYRLSADFGPTGGLAPGPNRIRYVLKHAREATSSEDVLYYFSLGDVSLVGEGIW